jgi:hypothetical protein
MPASWSLTLVSRSLKLWFGLRFGYFQRRLHVGAVAAAAAASLLWMAVIALRKRRPRSRRDDYASSSAFLSLVGDTKLVRVCSLSRATGCDILVSGCGASLW